MADVVRNSAEAVDIEATIILGILAHHIANFEEGFLIWVHVTIWVLEVERALVFDLKVAKSEVDGEWNVHLPTLFKVLN